MVNMHWNYTVTVILSLSVFIAGIIAIFRFAQISDVYRPFIYLIWIACITEVLNIYFAYRFHYNVVVMTIYGFCESLLLLWFFSRLGIFKGKKNFLYFLISFFLIIWFSENFLGKHFGSRISYYFDIVYAFLVVLFSIRAINDLLFTEKELLKNPAFLICIGLIIFFTYQIVQRMFGLFGLRDSIDFRRSVQRILSIINCLANLIYALAVLWMRKRKPFTFQF
jgi:hypothetical protein